MHVIQAHRERIAELAEALRRVLVMERDLLDLRASSWALQVAGLETREADLNDAHQKIDDKMLEVENLRQILATPAPGSKDVNSGEAARTA